MTWQIFFCSQITIIIHERDDEDDYKEEEIEVSKKPGKGFGMSIVGYAKGEGAYINEIVSVLYTIIQQTHLLQFTAKNGHFVEKSFASIMFRLKVVWPP